MGQSRTCRVISLPLIWSVCYRICWVILVLKGWAWRSVLVFKILCRYLLEGTFAYIIIWWLWCVLNIYLFQIINSVHLHHMVVFRSCLRKALWVGVPTHFLYCSLHCEYFWPTILYVHLVVTFMCLSMAFAWHFQNFLLEECGNYSSLGVMWWP